MARRGQSRGAVPDGASRAAPRPIAGSTRSRTQPDRQQRPGAVHTLKSYPGSISSWGAAESHLVVHPARNRTSSGAYFAPACVVVLDGRQPACVLRLGRNKVCSQPKSNFSPDGPPGLSVTRSSRGAVTGRKPACLTKYSLFSVRGEKECHYMTDIPRCQAANIRFCTPLIRISFQVAARAVRSSGVSASHSSRGFTSSRRKAASWRRMTLLPPWSSVRA